MREEQTPTAIQTNKMKGILHYLKMTLKNYLYYLPHHPNPKTPTEIHHPLFFQLIY